MKKTNKIQLNSVFRILIFSVLILLSDFLNSQVKEVDILTKNWKAQWISVPDVNPNGYGVYYFRKQIDLGYVPTVFPIHVSADNRYKLYVNEKLISLGPARADLLHWNYETVDLAPYLHAGKNVIAAQVWNEGAYRAEGHISLRTGFILQGGTADSEVLNTNETWKCIQDKSYNPIPVEINTFYVAGPGEKIHMALSVKDWNSQNLNDKDWLSSKSFVPGLPKNAMGFYGVLDSWLLVPSSLPQMELTQQRFVNIRKTIGTKISTGFLEGKEDVKIPAKSKITVLLDQSFLTNAYPTLVFSGGKNSEITISYQEALFLPFPEKGNRNVIDGKSILGRKDQIISDGSSNQSFTTLNYRTYRYVEIIVKTKEEPLTLNNFYGTFTGYPFQMNAKIQSENPELQKLMEIGWRTARLCAMETYMDCPYYEQLQYIGDGRIQALVSLFNSGDDRLVKNALNLMQYSQQPEGVTASRHPSVTPQYISTFSLWYIGILHDYMMYGKDLNFVKDKLQSARLVLDFFKKYQGIDGSLKNIPYWTFSDWVYTKGWKEGIGPIGKDGNSALLDMQLLLAYQVAADLEFKLGVKEIAESFDQSANTLKATIRKKYWDENRQLFADTQDKDFFSQHTNSLAILTGISDSGESKLIADKLLKDTTLAPASIYFKFYLHQALTKAGYGDDYLKWLDKWRENVNMGLTTWAETSDVNSTRSDCHAWGSSPNIEFFRILLGIDSDAPGFSKVRIEPHLGDLKEIKGEMPHPFGVINVQYKMLRNHLNARIDLPKGLSGIFIWENKTYNLGEGLNNIIEL